jgi:hypothetical protein
MVRRAVQQAGLLLLLTPACVRAGQDRYCIESQVSQPKISVGETAVVVLSIRLRPGATIDPEAPLKAVLLGRNLQLDHAELTRKDARLDPAGARFEVPVRGRRPGPAALYATLHFFVCVNNGCTRHVEDVRVPLEVR